MEDDFEFCSSICYQPKKIWNNSIKFKDIKTAHIVYMMIQTFFDEICIYDINNNPFSFTKFLL
jgi:hypothetical protein